jgi:hypothetical protein
VLGPDAIAYSTVTKRLRQRKFPAIPCDATEELPTTIIDGAILDALEKQPFFSILELAKPTCIPKTTIHRHFTRSRGNVLLSQTSNITIGRSGSDQNRNRPKGRDIRSKTRK